MASPDWTEAELDAEYARAARAGRRAARSEPRAAAARYEPSGRRLVVDLASGATLLIPVDLLEGLAGAGPEALATVELAPGGGALRFPALDADFSVPGLVAGVFGSRAWMRGLAGRGRAAAVPLPPPPDLAGAVVRG